MAVDAKRLGHRVSPDTRAARERRQKIILGVGVVVLVGLGAFQGPKTLHQLRGGRSPASPSPVAPTATPTVAPAGEPVPLAAAVRALRRFPVKDPFVVQIKSPSPTAAPAAAASPPAVRTSGFVVKNPFVQQVSSGSRGVPAPPPATKTAGSGSGGYIVVLESISLADGRGEARAAVAAARKAGLHAGVLESTKYATLRSGYLAVYLGPYSSVDRVLKALSAARAHGYGTAYARRLRG